MTTVVQIDRGTKYDVFVSSPSIWKNRFTNKFPQAPTFYVSTPEEALVKYRQRILTSPHLMEQLPKLKGKILGYIRAENRAAALILANLADAA